MSLFGYKAKNSEAKVFEGKIEADSQQEAVEKLSQAGYMPLHIEALDSSSGNQHNPSGSRNLRIRTSDVTIFTRQLASLLRSGVPFLRAVSIIQEQTDNKNLRNLLISVHNSVKDGSSLSSALSQFPKVFPPLYVAMVKTGENSGALPDVLIKIADYRAKHEEALARIRMALAYPVLMVIVGVATIVFMLTFVMPRLTGLYSNMGQELPAVTRALISISSFLQYWWFWILAGFGFLAVLIKRQNSTSLGKQYFDAFKLGLPLFGGFSLKSELARFCRTLELLLRSGLPILKALEVALPVLDNQVVKEKLSVSYKDLEEGVSFGASLRKLKFVPLFMSNLISVGEESGKLYESLAEVASSYEKDIDEAIKTMSNLLEPVMVLFMGLVVGFIVIAMLLPVFEINIMAG